MNSTSPDYQSLGIYEEMARALAKGYARGALDFSLPSQSPIRDIEDIREFSDWYAWMTVKNNGVMPPIGESFKKWQSNRTAG